MVMRYLVKVSCVFFLYFFFTQFSFAQDRKPLSTAALKKLVIGNTIIGSTCHSGSTYLLYFFPNGKLYFEKNSLPHQTYIGKWWIKNNEILSQWKSYKRTGINVLRYYHMDSNVYQPYNVNDACGPAGTFGHPFMVMKGPYTLRKLKNHFRLPVCNNTTHCTILS